MRPVARGVAAGASAGLCVLAAPRADAWLLAFICWVPLLLAIRGLRVGPAAMLGLAQGVLLNGAAQFWVFDALRNEAGLSVSGAALLSAAFWLLQGARSGALAALVALASRRGWPWLVSFPLALVTVELLHPMIFPWSSAVFVQAEPIWLQLAELGGPLAISAWLGLVNASVASALLAGRPRLALRALAPGVGVLLAVAAFGALRMRAVERSLRETPVLRVGVVHGDVDKRSGGDPVPVHRDASLALLRAHPELDLLLWPETSVPYPTRADALPRFFRDHGLRDRRDGPGAERIGVPVLAGMVLVQEAGLSNSAVLATPDARVLGIYDKQRLIPIGERDLLPDLFGARPLVSAATPFRVVRAVKALRLGSIRLLVTICYEDMLPSAFRSNVRRTAPDLLVNLGSARWFRGSSASALHLGLAKLRAVEHRRFLIRVTKDGVSAVVSPSGRVVRQLESARRQSGVAEVRLLRHRTVYAYLGDAPWFVGALACLLACVAPAPSPSARAPGLSPAPRAAPSPPSGRACRSPR